ncbi:hypothetical protein Q5H91_03050 [Sphingomonas sp. KR1UV-12]|uniref:NADH-quinone oxidoreductase subunit L n=1 Tax=Sphingomonas aurea TaxID=3063994 RepID=A0ABT9EGU7_9SPHN|nr:hypothetical protein [Sphingomonas sp. KR1UV-12]MDP1026178.1 hypothetical protein [Sphingomonas sp. KR1UV-12]
MNSTPSLIFYLLVLILPIAALAARRVPMRTTVLMVSAWAAIFAIGFLLFSYFT